MKYLLLGSLIFLVGCGGGSGGAGIGPGQAVNPFSGNWSANSDTLSVSSTGSFSAQIKDSQNGINTWLGTVSQAGTIAAKGSNSEFTGVTLQGGGQMSLTTGKLTITLTTTEYNAPVTYTETFSAIQ